MSIRLFILLAVVAAPARAAAPPRQKPPEAIRMLAAILAGKPIAPPGGWFGPSEMVHGWDWLAERCGVPGDGAIPPTKFLGSKEAFTRLDRDGNGRLTRADLDPRARRPANSPPERMLDLLISRFDRDKDGRLSAQEWRAMFSEMAGEKDELTREDLRRLLLPPELMSPAVADKTQPRKGGGGGGPSRWTLLQGFLNGEIGSMHEGPSLREMAPDFTLKTYDGKRQITLSDYRNKKPVVLVFGSFT